MKRAFIFLFAMHVSFSPVFAQANQTPVSLNLGFGAGLDYGGLGVRLSVSPVPQASLFGALGWNLLGLGYNTGAAFRLLPNKSFCPFIIGMYGYNTALLVIDDNGFNSSLSKVFNGASAGIGFEKRTSANSGNYLNVEVLYPFRSQEFKDYKTKLQNIYNVTFISLPIDFSLGYHITLFKSK